MCSKRTDSQQISGNSLEDLEYADDLDCCLILSITSQRKLGTWRQLQHLGIKSKITKLKIYSSWIVTLEDGSIDEVYTPGKCSITGSTDQNTETILGKARSTFRALGKLQKLGSSVKVTANYRKWTAEEQLFNNLWKQLGRLETRWWSGTAVSFFQLQARENSILGSGDIQGISDTTWGRQHTTELDNDKWSVAYAPMPVTEHKSSKF